MGSGGSRSLPRLVRHIWPPLLLAIGVLAVAMIWWPAPQHDRSGEPGLSTAAPAATRARREARPTLDPARFVGKAALAHQVAREIPDTLDQLYCYCECDKHSGHKSLLSCYTDGHAAT